MPKFDLLDMNVETPGLIADPVKAYLESQNKTVNKTVLDQMLKMFEQRMIRQIMQPRETRKGRESNTLYSSPCARKARFIFDGADRSPLTARTMLKFILGDCVEIVAYALAVLAGVKLTDNNADLSIQGEDMKLIDVHPDGLLEDGGRFYNVEIKSCDSHTFDRWLAEGGPSDDWGYRTQATVEVQAWREAMKDVNETIFLAVSTGTRQGSIAEWRVPFDSTLLAGWHSRRADRQQASLPPIAFSTIPEFEFVRGKNIDASHMEHGEPSPRTDKGGKVYGHDVPTGREIVPMYCSYCDFLKTQCWKTAELDMKDGKPIWVVPPKRSQHLASPEEFQQFMEKI